MKDPKIFWVEPDKAYTIRNLQELLTEVCMIEKAIKDWLTGVMGHKTFLEAKKRHRQYNRSTAQELNSTNESFRSTAVEIVRRNEAATIHSNLVERSALLLQERLSDSFNTFRFEGKEYYLAGDDPAVIRKRSIKVDLQFSKRSVAYVAYPFPCYS